MMHNTWLLARVQLTGMLGVNKLRHGDTKERRNALLMGGSILILLAMALAYILLFTLQADAMGMLEALPAMMLMAVFFATLFFTVLKSNGLLFGNRDHELLLSLPVRQGEIILSRLLAVYLMNLLYTLLLMGPALVLLALRGRLPGPSLLFLPVLLLLSPVLPMVVGMAAGALITAVSVRFKYRNALSLLLTLLLVVALMGWSFTMQSTAGDDLEQLMELGALLAEAVYRSYPPARLFSAALLEGSGTALLLFALMNLLPAALFVAVLSRFYLSINSLLQVQHTKGTYRLGALRQGSPLRALYRKELRRLLSSNVYLLNSCIGAVLLLAGAVALAVLGPARLEQALAMPGLLTQLGEMAPFFVAFFVALTCTTSASFNMEGPYRWLLLSLPVETGALVAAKVAVNLTVLLPAIAISAPLVGLTLRATALQHAMLLLLPCAYAVFISVLGAYINLALPKYDWTGEQQAVKQSASVMATILIGMLTALAPLLLSAAIPQLPLQLATTAVLLAASAALFTGMRKRRLYL